MPVTPEAQLAIRVPPDLVDRVEAAARSQGLTKRAYVIAALEAALAANR
jgi:predicted DNA-binding protein